MGRQFEDPADANFDTGKREMRVRKRAATGMPCSCNMFVYSKRVALRLILFYSYCSTFAWPHTILHSQPRMATPT